jgi:hypothetical protein
MQKETPNIEKIALDLDNLIYNYLQSNNIKDLRINVNLHNVELKLFPKDINYFKRLSEDNKYYLVHTKEIKKFSFTFFSQDLK